MKDKKSVKMMRMLLKERFYQKSENRWKGKKWISGNNIKEERILAMVIHIPSHI